MQDMMDEICAIEPGPVSAEVAATDCPTGGFADSMATFRNYPYC